MKLLTSMTTTTLLIITILFVNFFATLTVIYLHHHDHQSITVAKAAPDQTEQVGILAEKAKTPEKPQEAEKKPQAPPAPPYHGLILRASKEYRLDPALLRAVIMAESSYNPKAVSHRGAQGLMQLMPSTAAELGVTDSFDPAQNINGGAKYLRKLMDRFDNDVQLALAAYNAGSRYVRQYKGVPPFRATQLYIKKVIKYRTLYKNNPSDDNRMV